ncbi:cysteine--tRNA ligase [Bythopirellula polymerisocia]|uniref:Cysteine--tRNA ligase n=1 Tax=Bythopirellula polymerisocia TaxID=2528003 RepID=A0A5C6CGS9_9BACT|nr:cysteine--tRNA ligase [Bythopirellula polymerisocia]TWU21949.1 Cysteine--tRNA ligase [Bythopirellula polymerisocia]
MSTMTETKLQAPALSEPHPTLHVYNTLSKKKEPFRTVEPGKVSIYLCGPTVYDKAHIGHMVGPVIFDCIKRYLRYCGYEVTWVVNITDVDDKLIKKANERGITMLEVAEENIADYNFNLQALGVDTIDHFPRATDCMDEIIELIDSLVEQGFAYESQGDVYFEVSKDRGYGKLSNRNVEQMQGEGGETAVLKRGPADFALWKTAKPGEPSWESPWGKGRPGWHIECSAMSRKLLGETFDIHGGGLDLVFPHHENEIAQSECCHSKPMVTYWAHNGLLRASSAAGKVGGRGEREGEVASATGEEAVSGKMSRSKGAGGLAQLIERQGGERIRFFLLRTHYRSTVLFNEPAIEEAGSGLDGFYRLFKRYARITGKDFYELVAPLTREEGEINADSNPVLAAATNCRKKFLTAMDDDFNTGGAIGELFELAKIINKHCDDSQLEGTGQQDTPAIATLERSLITLKELTSILGLFGSAVAKPQTEGEGALLGEVMQLVIDLRAESRAKKNFATADAIRDGVGPIGIVLEDRAGGTEWSGGGADALEAVMRLLIELRQTARATKDFATSDAIRDRLAALGVTLEDRAGGTEWTKA